MSALCRNLKDGKVSTQSINNLRTIDVNDLLSLQINPEFAFKELIDMTRMRKLHGKFVTEREEENLHSDERTTRSGNSYHSKNSAYQFSQIPEVNKSNLKIKNSDAENYYSCAPAQKLAIMRGLLMSKRAGNKLPRNQINILSGSSNAFSQTPFTVQNIIRKKAKSGKKLRWNEEVSFQIDDKVSMIKLNDDNEPGFKQCHYSRIALDPFGILSLKETALLKK